MRRRLFGRRRSDDIPAVIYGAIVAQSRNPALYAELHVADSVEGRMESIILHLVLVLRRAAASDQAIRDAGQAVFDLFCVDMDRSMREMGVGDLSVPKRMREIGELYYGRSRAYAAALNAGDRPALVALLERSVPAADDRELAAEHLAAYMQANDSVLAKVTDGELLQGNLAFADPGRQS